MYGFYLLCHTNGHTHVSLIASSVNIITKRVAVMYQFKSARMVSVMLRLICMFVGCDMPIQLVLSSEYDDWKIMYRFTSQTCYKICNILSLNKDLATRFYTCSLPIQLLLCVNKHHGCSHHMILGNGVWQRCYGGDHGYTMWNFAGKVTYQGLVIRVQPLCFVWF